MVLTQTQTQPRIICSRVHKSTPETTACTLTHKRAHTRAHPDRHRHLSLHDIEERNVCISPTRKASRHGVPTLCLCYRHDIDARLVPTPPPQPHSVVPSAIAYGGVARKLALMHNHPDPPHSTEQTVLLCGRHDICGTLFLPYSCSSHPHAAGLR